MVGGDLHEQVDRHAEHELGDEHHERIQKGDAELPGARHLRDKSMFTRVTVFQAAGGADTFKMLVERFYARVASDPVLRPIYPEDDLSSATERLTLFLIQYWGGPTTYSAQRGHPRLRLRHQPFAIGQAERDAWLVHMTAAVNSLDVTPEVRKALLDYFETTSTAMINRPSRPEPSRP